MMPPRIFFYLTTLLFWGGCSVPDLSNADVFEEAMENSIDLDSLNRKFMFGMLYLYVDGDDSPYSGWVKTKHSDNRINKLGYLKNGMKEGLWITWDINQSKHSEIHWTEDRMEGKLSFWHPNGQLKTIGLATDGEVDGNWTDYYSSGQIAAKSLHRLGHLVNLSAWKPDGSTCPQSGVKDGNGIFYEYREDGSKFRQRTFKNGIETTRINYGKSASISKTD
jgi:antitoxin component YwqK of YwqJK toxin-antitoxin module